MFTLSDYVWAERTIRLITSSSIAPYVIAQENKGMVVDIMREALAADGYKVQFIYSTNRRINAELQNQRVDGAFNLPYTPPPPDGFYFSEPIVYYQNVIVTLSQNIPYLNDLLDLSKKHVTVFQNAHLYLPEEYKHLMTYNPTIEEVADQQSQVFMLFMGRTDAIILDKNIFYYYFNRLSANYDQFDTPFTIHTMFQPASRHALFKSEELAIRFNQQLSTMKETGRYQEIVHSYIPSTKR